MRLLQWYLKLWKYILPYYKPSAADLLELCFCIVEYHQSKIVLKRSIRLAAEKRQGCTPLIAYLLYVPRFLKDNANKAALLKDQIYIMKNKHYG